ncbi:MAG: ABC transporter substrate-binding protein, partial [Cohnella sp.]|nr:ABC transporter substrate-binding protein [Cohnella sp.]
AKNDQGITPFAYNHANQAFFMAMFAEDPGKPLTRADGSYIAWDARTKESMAEPQEFYKSDEYIKFANTMYRWQQAGVLPKNALSQKEQSFEMFNVGKSAVGLSSLDQISNIAVQANKDHPDWKVEVFIPKYTPAPSNYTQNGVAINARSKNPERALMFLDLLKWNQAYSDLTWYGIEGKHWEDAGEGRFKALADSSKYPPGANDPWGWRGPNERWSIETNDDVVKALRDYRTTAHEYTYGYLFNYSEANVKNEKAALTNLATQYMDPASVGLIDYNTAYAKFEAAAKKAGLDKVKAELKTQLDAFVASHP